MNSLKGFIPSSIFLQVCFLSLTHGLQTNLVYGQPTKGMEVLMSFSDELTYFESYEVFAPFKIFQDGNPEALEEGFIFLFKANDVQYISYSGLVEIGVFSEQYLYIDHWSKLLKAGVNLSKFQHLEWLPEIVNIQDVFDTWTLLSYDAIDHHLVQEEFSNHSSGYKVLIQYNKKSCKLVRFTMSGLPEPGFGGFAFSSDETGEPVSTYSIVYVFDSEQYSMFSHTTHGNEKDKMVHLIKQGISREGLQNLFPEYRIFFFD